MKWKKDIANGMQVALAIALIATFVFEMVAGRGGRECLEIMAATFFKAPELLTALFAMLLLGVALDRLLRLIRARVLVWLHELATAVVPLDGMAGPCA